MLTPNTHSIGRLGSPSLPSSTPLVPASETPPTSINQVATQGQRQHQTEDGGIEKTSFGLQTRYSAVASPIRSAQTLRLPATTANATGLPAQPTPCTHTKKSI
ncbi:hypothetical protein TNCV_3879621 [Trichonephila clavipes]|nr:hypothetical protein TNCV_3879621 [Trichonephila clavipes]